MKAKNVSRGDMVLFRKEYVDKSLEEVEEYLLAEDERYRSAKGMLFEGDVTRLRVGLWRDNVMRERYENLEERILGNDFGARDFSDMARRIHYVLVEDFEMGGPRPVGDGAARKWLDDTVAPADWNMFRGLARINPAFNDFYNDFVNSVPGEANFSENVYDAYRLFVGIRRGIMRYLARPKGRGKGGGGKSRDDERLFSLGPEIDIVLKYVLDEINEDSIAAVVTSVRDIEYEIGEGYDAGGVKLSSGVVTGRREPEEVSVRNVFEVVDEGDVMASLLGEGIVKYLDKRRRMEGVDGEGERVYVANRFNELYGNRAGFFEKNSAAMTLINKTTGGTDWRKLGVEEDRVEMLDGLAERVCGEVVEGPTLVSDVEKSYRIVQGVRFMTERINLVPDVVMDFYDVDTKLNFFDLGLKKRKEFKKKRKEMKRVLIGEYMVDPDTRTKRLSYETVKDNVIQSLSVKMGGCPNYSQSEWDRHVKRYAKQNRVHILSNEEEREIARNFGFEDFLDLSWIDD
jgi:hypothetical protein